MIFWDKVCRKPLMVLGHEVEYWEPTHGVIITHPDQAADLAEDEVELAKWRKVIYLCQEDFDNDPSWAD